MSGISCRSGSMDLYFKETLVPRLCCTVSARRDTRENWQITSENNGQDFPVVCVGGSVGGLDAYIRLLKDLPVDMGVAIVIVNHLRTVATRLHEILPRKCRSR